MIAAEPCSLLVGCNRPEGLFYREAHREIAQVILDLHREGAPVDWRTVGAELHRRGQLERNGGPEYLLACGKQVPSPAHAKRYLGELERCRAAREMIRVGQALQAAGYGNPEDPATMAQALGAELEQATTPSADFARAIAPLGEHIERVVVPQVLHRADTHAVLGFTTGWTLFDAVYRPGGFQPGRVTVLMAPRKTGKSTITAHLAHGAATQGFPAAVYSGEMSQSEVALKVICQRAGLPASQVELGNLTPTQRDQFQNHAAQVAGLPLYVNSERGRDVHGVLAWARRLKEARGIRFLAVDYLQLLTPHLARETMERNVSDAARRFVLAAQALDLHVLLVAQMNAEGAAKWSGQTNDDAHMNWRVIRCGKDGKPNPEGEFFLYQVEQRFGKSGTVKRLYAFDGSTGRITETDTNPFPEQRYAEARGEEDPFDGRY
jgi:replicative DNA helicase